MLCSLYVLFSLILYNDNVNIGGNTKFSSYSSLYCFWLYDKLTYIAIYRGKYLQQRIPHASHGSFNPYIISNKEAHIINGNITEGNIKNNISEMSQQKSLKCKNCGVRQRQAECKRDASVHLHVHLDDKDAWLTAFTDVLGSLFATHPTISLLSDSDTIEELLMDITDIKFTYNMNRKVITKISSSSLITG